MLAQQALHQVRTRGTWCAGEGWLPELYGKRGFGDLVGAMVADGLRLALVQGIAQVIASGLAVMGVEPVEEMR